VNIEIVERAPARVACLRYTGPVGDPLGRFWRATVSPWLAEQDLMDCPRYGVSIDDPTHTPPESCRYDACVELPPGLALPDARQSTIAGGRYAVTCFRGTAAQVGAGWTAFFTSAVVRGLARDAARPLLEHYPRGAPYDQRTGVFACQLCIPVGS
jgi:AraC family transcriptional regulator